jgi:Tfp pilus assembly protein PilO
MNTATRRISIVALAAALVIVAVWYLALFSPQSKKLASAHKAQAAAEQQVTQLQGQVTQLEALQKQIPADQKRFSALSAAIPDNAQLDSALRDLHSAAVSSGATLSSVTPSAPSTGAAGSTTTPAASQSGAVPSITLAMTASGDYGQLRSFLSNLYSMQRTLVINQLAIAGTGNQLSASISAEIFYAGQANP